MRSKSKKDLFHKEVDYTRRVKVSMNLPVNLLDEARRAMGTSTRTDAVILSLKDSLRRKAIKDLIGFAGKGMVKLSQAQLRQMRRR